MLTNVTPPTDNLYKFIALFGLALVVLGFYVFNSESDRLTQGAGEMNVSLRALAAELGENAAAQKVLAETVEGIEGKEPPNNLLFRLGAIDGVSEQAKVLALSLQQTADRYLGDRGRAQRKANQAAVGGGAGLVIAIAGFWWWYFRLQRYQDAAVKKQAGSLMDKRPVDEPR